MSEGYEDPAHLAKRAGEIFINEQDSFDLMMMVYDYLMRNNGSVAVDASRAPSLLACFNQMKLVSEADPASFSIIFRLMPRLKVT